MNLRAHPIFNLFPVLALACASTAAFGQAYEVAPVAGGGSRTTIENASVTFPSGDTDPEGDPLTLYLASIQRLKALPPATLVLPSHGRPFTGLHTRIDQLSSHHDERFADVMALCAQAPQHAAGLLQVLFRRKLDLHQTTFAMGEAIAHLHALWLAGRLVRRFGDDGIYRFAVDATPGM